MAMRRNARGLRGARVPGGFEQVAIYGAKASGERLHGEGQAVEHRRDDEAREAEGQGMAGDHSNQRPSGPFAERDEHVEADDVGGTSGKRRWPRQRCVQPRGRRQPPRERHADESSTHEVTNASRAVSQSAVQSITSRFPAE